MPIEPGDLSGYVLTYFGHFMTPEEAQERWNLTLEYKALVKQLQQEYGVVEIQISPALTHRKLLEEAYQDAKWINYWNKRKSFFDQTCERVLKQHAQDIFLNQCPYCSTLARTPTAKQCGKCFKRWDS
jgi:hypothetical protein